MKHRNILLPLLAAGMLVPVAQASAQTDLSSQRKERQAWNAVPGKKIDHKGIVINPTPQSLTRPNTGSLNASGGFKVSDKKKAFASDLGFLKRRPAGLPLAIDFGAKQAAKAGVKATSGAYALSVGKKGVKITGYDELGAFYGLQTLRQLLDADAVNLPMLEILDYPALKYRGVVEGFYGTPWSHRARLSLIDFYGRNKMNNYIYGPKDDPYHSSPNWRKPYPADQAKQIRELVDACRKNRVQFVWAIHPGQDIRWNKEDYDSLIQKFDAMYDLGVRQFAIFFDDISGIGTDSHKQAQLINDLTRDFVKKKGDVGNLMICPTDYNESWANPTERGQLAVYGRELNPDVDVFWTGATVCADITPSTMEYVDSRIKRPALVWWNFPVTDYCRDIILQGPVYGLDTTLGPSQLAGIESNPMEHAEASKLSLYGVADWAWNPTAYNAIDNWERGLKYMMPEASDAYRTFAIHSADTQTGYRRDESWETDIFDYDSYTPAQFDALKAQFERIKAAPAQIESNAANKYLVAELKPWLDVFEAMGQRGLNTLGLIKTFETGDNEAFWNGFIATDMTPEQRAAYNEHRSGTLKLNPFIEGNLGRMRTDYYKRIAGRQPRALVPMGSFPNLRSPETAKMFDNDTATFYTTGRGQNSRSWIGVDLGSVRPVSHIHILQGRPDFPNETDYVDLGVIEISTDATNWKQIGDTVRNLLDITLDISPVEARYVRWRRLPESKRTNWIALREFSVDPVTPENLGLNLKAAQPMAAIAAFDENPATAGTLAGDVEIDRVKNADKLTLLASAPGNIRVEQLDKNGKVVASAASDKAFITLALQPSATRLRIAAEKPLNEVIQH